MGFLTSFSRSMYLTSYINSLERQLLNVTGMQADLSREISRMTTAISDLDDAESASVKNLKARLNELEALDKQLQARMQKIRVMLQAANTEKQSADGMLQQSIQQSFSYSVR